MPLRRNRPRARAAARLPQSIERPEGSAPRHPTNTALETTDMTDDYEPYEGMTNADVMTPAELAEADSRAEHAMDATDEPEACGEGHCRCYCTPGYALHACGCQCPHAEDCGCEDCLDAEEHDVGPGEWTEGECDRCGGSTPEELARAASGRSLMPVCVCAIGQGATSEDCECGTGADGAAQGGADQLAAIRQRFEGIAHYPGPWDVVPNDDGSGNWLIGYPTENPLAGLIATVPDYGEAIAEFLAAAREDVPALLDDNARLRERVAELERRVAELVEQRNDALVDIATGDVPDGPRERLTAALGTTPGTWDHLIDRTKARVERLRVAEVDLLDVRGLLSPDGRPRRVPAEIEIHERVAPAIEWLLNRVTELERERGEVIELTWSPQDILLGDDDTADLMLTTKDGRPANWRLDPDQRRALHDDLAPDGAETVEEWGVHLIDRDPHPVQVHGARDTAEAELARVRRYGRQARLMTRTTTYDEWQPVAEGEAEDATEWAVRINGTASVQPSAGWEDAAERAAKGLGLGLPMEVVRREPGGDWEPAAEDGGDEL